ncbi:acetolactate synthase 2 catalytic subunit [uncultured Salinisphaera sp.]|uniref:acetolactate synthase 2 catalytic subunit n=1 Tax=uncultured Salinisphaera sp. TaxID=359372 RepID=UPI0032B2A935
MNAAQMVLQSLAQHGVDTVFGYPGGCIMPLYDALVDDDRVCHVLCRHEQACALAADGYARASGRVGVCIATSGPGATNLITGVANAHRDSVPLVVITGQTPAALMGTDAFQEVDVLGMTLDIVKHSYLVTDANTLASTLDDAFELAASGRPGPVWIDIPKDVQLAEVGAGHALPSITKRSAEPAAAPPAQIDKALTLLRAAEKPLLYSGGGVSRANAEAEFRAFAATAGLPHVNTLNGIGNPGRDCADHLGMLGLHGSQAANRAVHDCDLLLVVGARLDDRATGRLDGFAPGARLVHIDIDTAEFNKLRRSDAVVRGDLNTILAGLTQALDAQPLAIDAWRGQCRQWRARHGFTAPLPGDAISGPAFVRALSDRAPVGTTVACDVGQHQMWVAQYFDFEAPRCHLSSGGLGTMGYGLPAAIGAQFAHPQRPVVNVAGDGSFQMNLQELATLGRYRLPVRIVVLDNACLGMVRQQQELFYANRESQIDLDDNPDFVALARAFGIAAESIGHGRDMASAIDRLFAHDGPCLLHVAVTRADNVWPTVRAGSANIDMIDAVAGHENTMSISPAQA